MMTFTFTNGKKKIEIDAVSPNQAYKAAYGYFGTTKIKLLKTQTATEKILSKKSGKKSVGSYPHVKLPMSLSLSKRIKGLTPISLFKKYQDVQNEIIDDLINEGFDEGDIAQYLCQHIVEKFGYGSGRQSIEDYFNSIK